MPSDSAGREKSGRGWWAPVAVGAAIGLAGYFYAMVASDAEGVLLGSLVMVLGIGVLIPALHGAIDP